LKYFKDTEADLNNVIVITGNFNIRDSYWDPLFPHHLIHADHLLKIADLFNLERLLPINLVLTRYADNLNDSNSIIDLMFLRGYSEKFDTHSILLDMRDPFNHTFLTINIAIQEELIQEKRLSFYKRSEKEEDSIKKTQSKSWGHQYFDY